MCSGDVQVKSRDNIMQTRYLWFSSNVRLNSRTEPNNINVHFSPSTTSLRHIVLEYIFKRQKVFSAFINRELETQQIRVNVCTTKFNIPKFYTLPTEFYLYVLYENKHKQQLFACTTLTWVL